ncbi:MAG: MFS transporter [Planctomycetota bacterium]
MTQHTTTAEGGLRRNRGFVLLWCAYGISALGDHLSEMALLKTQDALNADVDITPLAARMTFVFFVPFFLFAPIAGALADRWSRRGLMVLADLARFVVMMAFPLLIHWTSGWGSWAVFSPLLVVGLFAAIFSPARSALLPTLIHPDDLIRANAMLSGLGIIATMISALIGGYLAKHYAPQVAFQIDALTFLVSAALLLLIRTPRGPAQFPRGDLGATWAKLRDGFRYAAAHRHVMELLAIASLIWFCGPLVSSAIPAVVRDVYRGDYVDISQYRALLGLGFVIGAVIMTVLGDALRAEIAITWGLFGIGVGMSLFAASTFVPFDPPTLAKIGGVAIVLAGVFGVTAMSGFNALLQRTVADRYRGRVFGVNDVCTSGALLLATGLLGIPQWTHVDRWVGWILLGVALLALSAAVLTFVIRLRRGRLAPLLELVEHLNEFVARLVWGLRRVGRCGVPRTGPVIVTANHRSSPDPLLICAAAPYRSISFLIAAEYATWPVIRWLVRLVECIPVRRGTRDTSSTKAALRHLAEGKAMGVFIEGGIIPPGRPRTPKDGVALLALRSGAPVVPAYISGTKYRDGVVAGLLARHRARVRFGPPVDLGEFRRAEPSRANTRAATRRIYEAILALAPSEEREQIMAEQAVGGGATVAPNDAENGDE